MNIRQNKIILNLLIIAGLILFAFFYQGYKFGHGSQILEIPLLRNLIDTSFYGSDPLIPHAHKYYVTYTFRIISFLVNNAGAIPRIYLLLTIIFRGALISFSYLIFKKLFNSKAAGAFAALAPIALYTWGLNLFDHAGVALAVTFMAIYSLINRRFMLAGLLFGLACNSHILNSFWFCVAFFILILYSLLKPFSDDSIPRGKVIPSAILLILAASPIAVWVFRNLLTKAAEPMAGFNYAYLLRQEQSLWFKQLSFSNMGNFWVWGWIAILVLSILIVARCYRNSRKTYKAPLYFTILTTLLLAGPFILFLSIFGLVSVGLLARMDLWRNIHILLWIVVPFFAASEAKILETAPFKRKLISGLTLLSFMNNIALAIMLFVGFIYDIFTSTERKKFLRGLTFLVPTLFYIVIFIPRVPVSAAHLVKYAILAGLFVVFVIAFLYTRRKKYKNIAFAYIMLVVVFFVGMGLLNGAARVMRDAKRSQLEPYRQNRPITKEYKELMEYIRSNTPKNILILAHPNESNLHLYSERGVLLSSQLTLALFDESLARRMHAIYTDLGGMTDEDYSVVNGKYKFDELSSNDFINIAKKYNVTHILLKKNMTAPRSSREIYRNDEYKFYKVLD